MSDPALARRVELTGWSTVLVGALCIALGGVQALIPALLDRLAAELSTDGDLGLAALRDAYAAGAAVGAITNVAFGIALTGAGIGVGRRAPWSHRALTVVSWASIPAVVALAGPSVQPLLVLSGASAGSGRVLLVASAVFVLAQVVAVVWFLRFWGRDEVRSLFRPGAGGSRPAPPPRA